MLLHRGNILHADILMGLEIWAIIGDVGTLELGLISDSFLPSLTDRSTRLGECEDYSEI